MSPDRKPEQTNSFLERIEQLVLEKDPRLPGSIRKYIRNLKQAGQLEEAMKVRESEVKKKKDRQERIMDELNGSVYDFLTAQNLDAEIISTAKATFLLEAARIIDSKERYDELNQMYEKLGPNMEDALSEKISAARDGVASFLKTL